MSEQPLWQIRLTHVAEANFQQIVRWRIAKGLHSIHIAQKGDVDATS